jgi:hypothetical protein
MRPGPAWRVTRELLQWSSEQRGKANPCRPLLGNSNKKALVQGLLMGGTGLEPVTPQLVEEADRVSVSFRELPTRMTARNVNSRQLNATPATFLEAFQKPVEAASESAVQISAADADALGDDRDRHPVGQLALDGRAQLRREQGRWCHATDCVPCGPPIARALFFAALGPSGLAPPRRGGATPSTRRRRATFRRSVRGTRGSPTRPP